jgi:hypothetical protein
VSVLLIKLYIYKGYPTVLQNSPSTSLNLNTHGKKKKNICTGDEELVVASTGTLLSITSSPVQTCSILFSNYTVYILLFCVQAGGRSERVDYHDVM